MAFTVNSFVYFSFGNIYSSTILNYANFQEQFSSGIYQYRILSGHLLIWVYELLSSFDINYGLFKLKFFDVKSEPKMYLSFFILNTFFLVLSALIMILITETKNFVATQSEKTLIITVAIFTIAISQFVIVPYDVSSYFFLLLFFFFLIKYLKKNTYFNLIILVLIMHISTMNRESSALSISLAATFLYSKYGLKKESLFPLIILIITFISTYVGMRIMNDNFTTNDGNLLLQNFTQPKNTLGLIFWFVFLVMSLLSANDRKAVNHILLFHLLTFPYIMMCFYTGIIYEIRLYVPLFLTSLFLGKLNFQELNKLSYF